MRRWSLVALATLACTPDTEHLAAIPGERLRPARAVAVAPARVEGDAAGILYGGDRLRRVRFRARGTGGGAADGWVELQFFQRAPEPAGSPGRALRFDVTCLEVSGNRAWLGVRRAGRGGDSEAGGDVWYVEDGGAARGDRAGVWIGLAPPDCRTRPPITWALPLTQGDLVITAE